MSEGEMPTPLRKRFDEILVRLEASPTGEAREAVKRDIIALFKTVDQSIADLNALKDDIRGLVDKYKELAQSETSDQAPKFTGAVPAAVLQDHIGASTFVEKGWNLLSLGDYDGAIHALTKALELSPNDIQAQSQLGWAQMLKGDYDNALATFQQVLIREPANSLARINGQSSISRRPSGWTTIGRQRCTRTSTSGSSTSSERCMRTHKPSSRRR
jgi:tetratricopeptide (TPR) repeat protein